MSTEKFSQFTAGGALLPTDEVVGLRAGANYKFNAPTGQLLAVNNLSDVSNPAASLTNIGGQPIQLEGVGDPNGVQAGILGQDYWDQSSSYIWSCFIAGPAGTAGWRQKVVAVPNLSTTGLNVNVGLASPPAAGQVLTAISSRAATWQTPSATGDLLAANNLSDVQSVSTSRLNLSVPKVSSGSGNPNVSVAGEVNDEYFDESTTPSTFWRCITAGAPGVWEIPETNALNITSANFGEINFQSNATPTTFSAISTPTKIIGTYNAGELQNFTHSAGRLTCTALVSNIYDIKVATTGSLSFASDSVTIFIAVNGSVIPQSAQSVNLDGISPSFKSISLQKLVTLGTGDYVEIWVQNNTSTNSITHQDISLIVGSPGAVGSPTVPAPSFTGFTQTATSSVSNATVGVLNSFGVGSFTIPANSLSVGDILFLKLAGTATRDISSSTIRIALNANNTYFLFDTGLVTNLSPGNFTLEAFMTVRAVGGPGVASIQTVLQTLNVGSAVPSASFLLNDSTSFSTLVNTNLSLNVYWVSALPGNSCSAQILTLKKL
ncbi:hypothetical protein UFOVP459_6 [uncultured Caudovirales phage]|uniref:Uncharacterized protein n=1 Tax=uncultured Caudovirales phage TaxID=2100421 RepID=A0A6J5SE92_9CAUD|nr:hypothetical protein UFOVP459_6 [uncultured Caudovirales phage]CAB4182448.1 hypothetical protein UFOVP1089_3 [uncultured Caudovirales phage]CAB4212532.1 hypothetical protein UFOVP1443_22 [uncultured Caudovirales phage]